ncbi:CocE/NonD family hydrolase [Nocardia terpenica]|uniref:CocE/NonD family hydrolase n=1 Tax=Nocardia terpenica TaxID=455432 RepID=A0A6G9YZB0_9NOCA|nr:CocE/NonD family hydrolase [Nocardia terpenica]QIS18679.1 CocE/NonD family hydrolase [Nocardia terpenica]
MSWMTRLVAMVAPVLLAVGATAVSSAAAPDFTGIDGGGQAAQWTATQDGPQPYSDIRPELGVPITMSDGTVLKGDIFHPAQGDRATTDRTPTILMVTAYTRTGFNIGQALLKIPGVEQVLAPLIGSVNLAGTALEGVTDLTRLADSGLAQAALGDWKLVRGGYRVMIVDARGTGNSQGEWGMWGPREQQDTSELIDWITKQPWSDGTVGMTGISYSGLNQIQAAAHHPPGLKAIFPLEASADIAASLLNGGSLVAPAAPWQLAINLAKFVPDVESLLAGKFDPATELRWLTDRLASPLSQMDLMASAYLSTDTTHLSQKAKDFFTDDSPARRALAPDAATIDVPTFLVGGWFDAFARDETDTFDKIPLPPTQKKIIMGDGYHSGAGVGGFGHPGYPPRLDVLQRAWFDKWLKGIDNGIDHYSPVTVKQQGGAWSAPGSFPRDGMSYHRRYLTDAPTGTTRTALHDGSLSGQSPQDTTDLTVSLGAAVLCSRDAAQASFGITSILVGCTQDSQIRESNALTFTSPPVTEPTQISGPIAVHLNTVHEATDGFWSATLNDVAPDGQSRALSLGQLMSSLRAIDDTKSTRSPNGDYTDPHYYIDLGRREPTVPGQPITLDIGLIPTDAVLQPGHRLRVDVFAGNVPAGIPPTPLLLDSGLRPEHLRLDPTAPSWINIPTDRPLPE